MNTEFAAAVHDMLGDADVPAAARRWADGDLAPGLALWRRLAGLGVTALAVPPKWGGLGASPLELVVACEELGHHAVPGPAAESLAAVPALLAGLADPGEWLAALAAGDLIATLAMPPRLPFAAELDLSLWLAKVWALVPAWGSQAEHRARVVRELGVSDGSR